MKKVLLAGVAGLALVTGSAHAADLGRPPVYKAPPTPEQTGLLASLGGLGGPGTAGCSTQKAARPGLATSIRQRYQSLPNTSRPARHAQAGRSAVASNGLSGKIGPQKSSTISTTSADAT